MRFSRWTVSFVGFRFVIGKDTVDGVMDIETKMDGEEGKGYEIVVAA